MGRESRQSRRARQRRELDRRQHNTKMSGSTSSGGIGGRSPVTWSIVFVVALVAVGAAVLGAMALTGNASTSTNSAAAIPTPSPGRTIDGIQCNYNEMIGAGDYHVHGHVTILDHGQSVPVSAALGHDLDHDCLYWIHTHDTTGVIHIESPHPIVPTLGDVFDVWGQPLNSSHVASVRVNPGEQVKTFVNLKPYHGSLRSIPVKAHTNITIEIGGPFSAPVGYNFKAQNL